MTKEQAAALLPQIVAAPDPVAAVVMGALPGPPPLIPGRKQAASGFGVRADMSVGSGVVEAGCRAAGAQR